MVRSRLKPSPPPAPPAGGVKASTFNLLLDTAMSLIQKDGHIPSVAEVAVRSEVSRATAYRYFSSRSALITAVIETSLGPVRSLASDNRSGRERVHELFMQTFPRFKEFEPQLRAAAQLSLEQWALERAGLLEEEPYRRGHRIRILEHAIAPLAPELSAPVRDRLHKALSVVYGIEPYIILKDIWDLKDREVERIALWMADALIDAALRQSKDMPLDGDPFDGKRKGARDASTREQTTLAETDTAAAGGRARSQSRAKPATARASPDAGSMTDARKKDTRPNPDASRGATTKKRATPDHAGGKFA